MRPDGLDLIEGVQHFLEEVLLPELSTTYLQTQLAAAIGLLRSAANELAQALPILQDDNVELLAVCAASLPFLQSTAGVDASLLEAITVALAAPETTPPNPAASQHRNEQLRGLVGRIAAGWDNLDEPEGAALRRQAYSALRASTRRRLQMQAAPRPAGNPSQNRSTQEGGMDAPQRN